MNPETPEGRDRDRGQPRLRRELGRFDTAMVAVGGIIGAGIFINPYIVAQRLDSAALVLAAWLAGGVIALAGALTFAELGTLFPRAGGHYAYLRDAYHPLAGFLYGWGLLLMIEGGAIAAVGITFSTPPRSPFPARRIETTAGGCPASIGALVWARGVSTSTSSTGRSRASSIASPAVTTSSRP